MEAFHFPPESILAAVDFSQGSLGALEGAARLARRWGVPLRAAHVMEEPPAAAWQGGEERDAPDRRRASAYARLRVAVGGLGAARLEVREGEVVEELLAFARETKAGMLAVGSRGLTPWKSRLLGSVSAALVRRAGLPVLIVHGPLEAAWPQRVMVGAKFTEVGDRGLLYAARLAASVGGVVGAVHVRDAESEPQEASRALEEHLGRMVAACGLARPSFQVLDGRPAPALAEAAARGLYDLVVISDSRKPLGLGAGTARQLMARCAAPLLVLPAEAGDRVAT